MRKNILFLFILIISSFLYAQEENTISIDIILDKFSKNSIFKNIENLEIEKQKIDEKGFKFENTYKTDYTLKVNHLLDYNDKIPWKAEEKISSGEIYSALKYKALFIDITFDYSDENKNVYKNGTLKRYDFRLDIAKSNVGINQNLNDIFYSEEKYNRNLLKLRRNQLNYTLADSRQKEEEKVINEYLQILNTEVEIELKKNAKKENETMITSLKDQIEKGEATDIELEYLIVDNEKTIEEINYLNEKVVNLKMTLCDKVGITYNESAQYQSFSEVEAGEIKPSSLPLEVKKIEEKTEKENRKMIDRKSQPTLNVSVAYDMENQDWVANFDVAAGIFYSYADSKKKSLDIKKNLLEQEQLKKQIEQEEKELITEYKHLFNSVSISKAVQEAASKKYDLTKKMLMKGYVSTIEYSKIRNEYKEAELSHVKAINDYRGFIYKIINIRKISNSI